MKISIKREQSDACISSAEREKFGMKFKNSFRFLSMAALVLMGAVMTGCSNEDNIDNPQQPDNQNNIVTLTTTVSLDGGASTRALAADGKKTFAVGDKIAVVYMNTSSEKVKAESNALKSTDITNSGKSAQFTVTLTNPDKSGDVSYYYPATTRVSSESWDLNEIYQYQDGTLETLGSKADLCSGSGSWNNGNLPTVTLNNEVAILAITLKDNTGSSDITSTITNLTIVTKTESNYGQYHDYKVKRKAAAGPIYVAIFPRQDYDVIVSATDGTKNYIKTLSTTKTYKAGNGYNVSWKMAENQLAKVTAGDKGKVIGADGKIYNDASAAGAASTTAVAKIVCVYSGGETGDAIYNHGLALALADEYEGKKNWSDANTACTTTKNSNTPVTGGTWVLADDGQWGNMINGAGSYTALRDGFASVGGTNMSASFYWTSTVGTENNAWVYDFTDDATYGGTSVETSKNNEFYVRACLAF